MTDYETAKAILDACGVHYSDRGYALYCLGWSLSYDWTGAFIGGSCSLPEWRWCVRDGVWHDFGGDGAAAAVSTPDAEIAPRGMA